MQQPAPDFRDRSRRLAVFGVLGILAGVAAIALGLAHLALPWLGRQLDDAEGAAFDPRSLILGLVTYVVLGLVLIVAGRGSMQLRRWSRPLMLMLAWTWLMSGLLGLLMVLSMLDDLLILATAEVVQPQPELLLILKVVMLGATFVAGIAAPALFIAAYQPRDVANTLDLHDRSDPSTDCPAAVLALAAGLGLAAVLALPMALLPVVPLFGFLVTGYAGSALMLLGAAALSVVALDLYRGKLRGWWSAVVLFIAVGASVATTFTRIPLTDFYREMGYPERQIEMLSAPGSWGDRLMIGSTIVVTLISLLYMRSIRKHFR